MMAQIYRDPRGAAKLVKIPKKCSKSKTKEKGIVPRMISFDDTMFYDRSESRTSTPSTMSCRSQRVEDLNGNPHLNNGSVSSFSRSSSAMSSSSSSRSMHNLPSAAPLPKVNSFSRSPLSESPEILNINDELRKSARKITTTVTVHLSNKEKTRSTPNLLESVNYSSNKHFIDHQTQTPNTSLNQHCSRSPAWSKSFNASTRSNSVANFAIKPKPLSKSKQCSKSLAEFNEHQDILKKNPCRELELNSLQVFRQQKYKARSKAEKRIMQSEHLHKNNNCNEVVRQLRNGIQPNNAYENIEKLRFVDYINEAGFITSSRSNKTIVKHDINKLKLPPKKLNIEPIYAEIREDPLDFLHTNSVARSPCLRKKVTFSTFHEPILEMDPFFRNKKIIPAEFLGIVQVVEPMRSMSDFQRRRMAALCHHVIQTENHNHCRKCLGKLDTSRKGEVVYILLEENSFDIRDEEGLVLAKHNFTDVSVVNSIQEVPHLMVYIGKCKFHGRIGVTFRFAKSKYVSLLLNYFAKGRSMK